MISATRYLTTAEINRQADLSQQLAKLQQQVSSGKRIATASDDPAAAARIADIRQVQADQVVWTNNVNTGTAISASAESNLSTVANLLDRAKELMLSGTTDSASAADRSTIAGELRALATNLGTYATASDPTGAPLFPDGTPLQLPVSATLELPATASRASVFDQVTTASGTATLADILTTAASSLEETGTVQRTADTQASIAAIQAGTDHIAQVRADQGVRSQHLSEAKDALSADGDALTTERSSLEDTDLTYALAQFQAKQLSLQAAQTVFAQSHKSTLFDVLG